MTSAHHVHAHVHLQQEGKDDHTGTRIRAGRGLGYTHIYNCICKNTSAERLCVPLAATGHAELDPEVENSHASPCLRTDVAYLAHSSVQKASTARSMRESRPPSAMIPSTPDAARRTAVSTASTVHANTLLPR